MTKLYQDEHLNEYERDAIEKLLEVLKDLIPPEKYDLVKVDLETALGQLLRLR